MISPLPRRAARLAGRVIYSRRTSGGQSNYCSRSRVDHDRLTVGLLPACDVQDLISGCAMSHHPRVAARRRLSRQHEMFIASFRAAACSAQRCVVLRRRIYTLACWEVRPWLKRSIHGAIVAATGRSDRRGDRRSDNRRDDRLWCIHGATVAAIIAAIVAATIAATIAPTVAATIAPCILPI